MSSPTTVMPFMNYMGGKRKMLPSLHVNSPETFGNYHEPFLGGGAFALSVIQNDDDLGVTDRTYFLSDYSHNVTNAWSAVKDYPDELATELRSMFNNHGREQFFHIRDWDSDGTLDCRTTAEKGARFIYLAQTCFNARIRSNKDGHLKPLSFGLRSNCDYENLHAVSELLNRHDVRISQASYEVTLENSAYGDFIYLDPPYETTHDDGTKIDSNYIGDNPTNHINVLKVMNDLTTKGAYVLQSNSDTSVIRELYKGWSSIRPDYIWSAGGGAKRASEILIANWRLAERLNTQQEQHSLSIAA